MTYNVQGISTVIWKFAKQRNTWGETYPELLDNLNVVLTEWLESDTKLPEYDILYIVISTFSEYCEYGIPEFLTKSVFNTIAGNKFPELFESESLTINHRIIVGILIALRSSEIYDRNNVCLINFGQEKE